MPYVITTRTDVHGDGLSVDVTTRTAVATLDEARWSVHHNVVSTPGYTTYAGFPTFEWVCGKVPLAGGTIGPLPDGTVIEVGPVSIIDLGYAAGIDPHDYDDEPTAVQWSAILAAFNAAQ